LVAFVEEELGGLVSGAAGVDDEGIGLTAECDNGVLPGARRVVDAPAVAREEGAEVRRGNGVSGRREIMLRARRRESRLQTIGFAGYSKYVPHKACIIGKDAILILNTGRYGPEERGHAGGEGQVRVTGAAAPSSCRGRPRKSLVCGQARCARREGPAQKLSETKTPADGRLRADRRRRPFGTIGTTRRPAPGTARHRCLTS